MFVRNPCKIWVVPFWKIFNIPFLNTYSANIKVCSVIKFKTNFMTFKMLMSMIPDLSLLQIIIKITSNVIFFTNKTFLYISMQNTNSLHILLKDTHYRGTNQNGRFDRFYLPCCIQVRFETCSSILFFLISI